MEISHWQSSLHSILLLSFLIFPLVAADQTCSNGLCKVGDGCSSNGDCGAGLYCLSCPPTFFASRCVRSLYTHPFKLLNNSLPFNKYAYLTTHNSFAIEGEPSRTGVPRVTLNNQEDTIAQQLDNGVRGFMLDTYDFLGDVWLCHSFGGKCHNYTAFEPALDTLKVIEAFLAANTKEIVTLILEDYVQSPNGLTKVFTDAGLKKFWFPITNMPKDNDDWPRVSDMVANNQRLLVFTSNRAKEATEGIAYQWNYMVENQYGNDGMQEGSCPKRAESSALDDKRKSLVLVNYFPTVPFKRQACEHNSEDLVGMLQTCHGAAGNRWANFVALDFYKRSDGGGAFQALDTLNGELLCGSTDIHSCVG
ncbi:PI-PLC X domain-containing protein At5g67130 [Cucurbita maxima]|uniref:PI-PLC X domain-containing protein At5g67130 n=1 Tax=Cucurbita maxima TaxID=3661 RepID=A0A6J1JJ27_CUCMA|nr:PI-PLC X domain-containing protein At5g67130 [Cucurbita maxima]